MDQERDIERIKSIIAATAERYQVKGGDVRFAGIEHENTVKIYPDGFCWR